MPLGSPGTSAAIILAPCDIKVWGNRNVGIATKNGVTTKN
jgi:hypothetical protein